MTIGQRIKEARKNAGLTQRELAEKSGTATGTIQQYEREVRQPRLEQLQAIAAALGVSVNQLLPEPTEEERATVADIIREIGMPHGPDGKASVAETKRVLRRVAEVYGENAVILLRLTSCMDEAGEIEVVEYAKSILGKYIDRAVFRAETPPPPSPDGKDTPGTEPPLESP